MNRALTRGAVPYKARSVAWYDPLTGEILDERDEQVVKVQPHASVVEVLRTVRARMLYLLPDETGRYPERSWFTGCIEIGCKIDKYLSKTHSVTISRGEKVIDIHPVGQYFDTAPSTTVPLKTWDGSTGSLPRCKSPTKKEPEKPFRTAYTGLSGAVVLVCIAKCKPLHRPLQRVHLCSNKAIRCRSGMIHRQTDVVKPLPRPILFRNAH
jgi:hypothetical protein